MGKMLDLFMLMILCSIAGFILLWGIVAIVEGAVCFGCLLTGVVWVFTHRIIIPLFKSDELV